MRLRDWLADASSGRKGEFPFIGPESSPASPVEGANVGVAGDTNICSGPAQVASVLRKSTASHSATDPVYWIHP